MAWASKKQYAILMSSEEGKDLAEQLGEMEQEEFNKKFSELLGKSGQSTTDDSSKNNEEKESQKRKIDTLDKELDIDKEVREMILQGKSDEEIKHYLDDTTEDFDWFEANDYLYDLREEIGVNEKGEYYKDKVDWWDKVDNEEEATFGKKEQPKNNSEINFNTLKEGMDKVEKIAKKLNNVKIGSDEFNAIINELTGALDKVNKTSAYLRQKDEEQSKR